MLSLRDVARHYGVTYGTAYQWARSGKIPAFQIGSNGPWRVYRVDLEAME